MKKIFFALLLTSFVPVGCSQPPGTNPGASDGTSGSSNGTHDGDEPDKDPGDGLTPEERQKLARMAECRKNPHSEGCSCLLNSRSKECFCSKPANESKLECICAKNPETEGCACHLEPNGKKCFCSKPENEKTPTCLGGATILTKCREYCERRGDSPLMTLDHINLQWGSKEGETPVIPADPLTKLLLDEDCDTDGYTNEYEIDRYRKYLAEGTGPRVRHEYQPLDPCKLDTDGDGIDDYSDTTISSKNGSPTDSDGDGIKDVREKELKLSPQSNFTAFNGVFGYEDRKAKKKGGPRYGASDKDLWIVNACERKLQELGSIEPEERLSQPAADIKMFLPKATQAEVYIPNDPNTRDSVILFADKRQGITGGLIAKETTENCFSEIDPTEKKPKIGCPLVQDKLGEFSKLLSHTLSSDNVGNAVVGASKKTHDDFDFAQAIFTINVTKNTNLQEVITEKIVKLNSSLFPASLGTDIGSTFSAVAPITGTYSLKVSVILRQHRDERGEKIVVDATTPDSEKNQLIYLYAFAPNKKTEHGYLIDNLTETRLIDLTNTTGITQIKNKTKTICTEMQSQASLKKVYFYFILDESGSMQTSNKALMSIAKAFFEKASDTELDFKAGVTNMAEKALSAQQDPVTSVMGKVAPAPNCGLSSTSTQQCSIKCPTDSTTKGGIVARWNAPEEEAQFIADVNVIKVGSNSKDEQGFNAAQQGLMSMKDTTCASSYPIDANAKVITIWVSDEADLSYTNESSPENKQKYLNKQIEYLKSRTTAFAIVAHPDKQGGSKGPGYSGYCYAEAALATGGAYGKLSEKAADYMSTLDAILDTAVADTSPNILPQTPISSTLQLYRDGSTGGVASDRAPVPTSEETTPLKHHAIFIPRGSENGFTYSAENNAISFTGTAKVPPPASGKRGEDFIVIYNFYDYQTKAF